MPPSLSFSLTFGDISFLAFLLGGLGDLDELLEYDSRRLGGGPRFFTGDLRLGVGDRPRFFTGDLRLGVRDRDRDRPFLSVFFVALAVAAVLEVFFTGDVFRFGDFSARFLGFGEARGGVARFLGFGELSHFLKRHHNGGDVFPKGLGIKILNFTGISNTRIYIRVIIPVRRWAKCHACQPK